MRGIRLRFRQPISRLSVVAEMNRSRRPAGERAGRGGHAALPSPWRSCLVVVRRRLRGVPGQGEEHVVERGPAQTDVVDGDPGVVELAQDLDQGLGAALRVDGQLAGVLVQRDLPTAARSEDPGGALKVVAAMDDHLDPLPAELRLQLVGRAPGDDLAVVDDRDRVGQLVGLLEVLRRQQQRRALLDEAPDDVPHPDPAARVEAGRRLVEDQQSRAADEGGAEVEAAAHAARVGLDDAVAGLGQLELLEQLVRRGGAPRATAGGRAVRTATGSRDRSGSRPPPRTGPTGRSPAGCHPPGSGTSKPATVARPASARSRVARIRTVVVLPAPFGPSRPRTVPSSTTRSTPSSARTSFLRVR